MIFVVDFDGTLAKEDTVDKLLEQHADPAWQELEAAWLAGKITALECMQGQVALVRADHQVLQDFFHSIELDPHFPAFHRHVSEFATVAIVSDGLDHTIKTTLKRENLETLPVFSNHLNFVAPDRLELTFPYREADCKGGNGVCKCAISRRLAATHSGPVILIGDGKSDACLAGEADMVFAKASLITHCEAEGIPYTSFENFGDVLKVVEAWDIENSLLATA